MCDVYRILYTHESEWEHFLSYFGQDLFVTDGKERKWKREKKIRKRERKNESKKDKFTTKKNGI